MRHPVSFIAVCIFAPSLSWAASFDCNRAVTLVEKRICSVHILSQLDETLSNAYQEAMRSVRDPTGLKRGQSRWLREVRNLCTDSVCLENEYRSRLAMLEKMLPATITGEVATATDSALGEPLKIINKHTDYSPVDYPIISYDGRLIFSQYDRSGNNFDILALDIANQSFEYILQGRPGAQFVAQSEKYLVVSEKGRFASPLVVIERASGKRISQIKLQENISWAKINGHRLVVIQGKRFSSGYAANAQALVLELPSLKVIQSTEIVGGNDVQLWQEKILSLGHDLAAYDEEFNELFRIVLPIRKRGERVSCAATWPLRVYADKAVVVANCGEILIYDLTTRQLERTIPSYSHFYAVAILDGLIFTTPTSEPKQKDSTHVYELLTGRELAILPINATDIIAKGNRLLAVEREFAKPSTMTLYSVDASAIRNGKWRAGQVIGECKKAETLLASTGDLYGAINMCKLAGIEGFVDEAKMSKAILSTVKQYAIWLSQALDRGQDAVPILEKLKGIAPDQEIESALNEAHLKARVLAGHELGELTEKERQTNFARVLVEGGRITTAETNNINFGSFSNLFHFSENRIYIGRYYNGASIGVLDRTTLNEIARIPIAPDDNEYQDNVTSIASDRNRIYVSVEYRYKQVGRPNFFVIDKESLKVIKKVQLGSLATLISDDGRLMTCGCHFTTGQKCRALDPVAMQVEEIPGKLCIQNEANSQSVVTFEGAKDTEAGFVAITENYLVAQSSRPPDAKYTIYPKTGGQPKVVRLGTSDSLSWPISVDGNSIIIREATRSAALIKLFSARTGTMQTLFGAPVTNSRNPVPILSHQTLFVGLGRDLLIFNLTSNRLQRYIKDFIPTFPMFNNNFYWISRLIVDRDRLIALTINGDNSRIARLADLTADIQ